VSPSRPLLISALICCGVACAPDFDTNGAGLTVVADGGASDAGARPPSCAISTCDVGGVWRGQLDAGTASCGMQPYRFKDRFTVTQSDGGWCFAEASAVETDGGCGFVVHLDQLDSNQVDPVSTYQTWDVTFDTNAGSYSGTYRWQNTGYGWCTMNAAAVGARD
jgi:hypothetical protein